MIPNLAAIPIHVYRYSNTFYSTNWKQFKNNFRQSTCCLPSKALKASVIEWKSDSTTLSRETQTKTFSLSVKVSLIDWRWTPTSLKARKFIWRLKKFSILFMMSFQNMCRENLSNKSWYKPQAGGSKTFVAFVRFCAASHRNYGLKSTTVSWDCDGVNATREKAFIPTRP